MLAGGKVRQGEPRPYGAAREPMRKKINKIAKHSTCAGIALPPTLAPAHMHMRLHKAQRHPVRPAAQVVNIGATKDSR